MLRITSTDWMEYAYCLNLKILSHKITKPWEKIYTF